MQGGCVVVTGAGGGIGKALAARLRSAGAHVVGIDRPGADLDGCHDPVFADVGDETAIRTALAGYTTITGVVSNAAVMFATPAGDFDAAAWKATLDTNVLGAALLMGLTAERLAASGGAFVAVGSVHATATTRGAAAYAASKGALAAFVRAAALDLGGDGVRVNAVHPGATDTPMLRGNIQDPEALNQLRARTPLGRVGEPADIAEAVLFLLDGQRAGFITGHGLVVDGGALARLGTE